MKFVPLLFLLLFLFVGCGKKEIPEDKGAVNMDGQIVSCYVHRDYYSCTLTSGYTYYVTTGYAKEVMATKTSWDQTAQAGGNET